MMADKETTPGPICPNCKSCEVVPLLGVLPGFAPYDTADVGRIPPAGQCADTEEDTPKAWRCEGCGHEWPEEGQAPERV